MKNMIKKVVMTVLAVTFVFTGISYGDYYNRHNVYDNYAYADYEFRHSNADFHINRYRGNIYYFHHYRANVYFVLVGPQVFVIPGYTFRSYMNRPNFYWVSRPDFIALSSANFGYYDSYVRFGFYFSFYDNNPWGVRNHITVTRNYRNYYMNRNHNNRYYHNHKNVMAGHRQAIERTNRIRHNGNVYKSRDNYRNVSYRNSGSYRHYQPVKRHSYEAAQKVKNWAKSGTYGSSHSASSGHRKSASHRHVSGSRLSAKHN